jgi:hypothetical protein
LLAGRVGIFLGKFPHHVKHRIDVRPSPVKFYKRGSQEKNFSYRRIFSDSPAHVMKEGFVLA